MFEAMEKLNGSYVHVCVAQFEEKSRKRAFVWRFGVRIHFASASGCDDVRRMATKIMHLNEYTKENERMAEKMIKVKRLMENKSFEH